MGLTRYFAVNKFITELILQIKLMLGSNFLGLYVGGSIAIGAFSEATSDIDCYVITEKVLSNDRIPAIEELHQQLYASDFVLANKLEISYIPKTDLIKFNINDSRPYFNEGCFYFEISSKVVYEGLKRGGVPIRM